MPVKNHLGKLENVNFLHLSILYILYKSFILLILFIVFSAIMSLMIWPCKKFFVKLWYCLILVISLNMMFVSARWLHKYQIMLVAKNTLLFNSFTSKNEMLPDVTVTVYSKCILLSKCELLSGLAERKYWNWNCHSITWNWQLCNYMTFKEK